MSAKTSPARRAAFMAVVADTGNQTLACERAKVSRSWVTLHRSTDPAFRAELDAAVAAARERLAGARAAGESMAPGRGWGSQGGEELVARGGNGRRQADRPRAAEAVDAAGRGAVPHSAGRVRQRQGGVRACRAEPGVGL